MSVLHLCIDMQMNYKNKDFSRSAWAHLEENTLALIDNLKNRNIPTVHVCFSKKFTPFKKGVGQFRDTPPATKAVIINSGKKFALNSALPLTPVSLVAYKTDFSAYKEKAIAHWIRQNGFSKIILSGVFEKNRKNNALENVSGIFGKIGIRRCCVSATARDLRRAGYDVVIAAETTQCGIKGRQNYLPLEERKKNHRKFGVKVMPVDELLFDLDKSALFSGARDFLFSRCARLMGL